MTLYIDSRDKTHINVALFDGEKRLGELAGANAHGSEVLLPLIIKLLQQHDLEFSDLSEITIEEGPGSFTGLKVGASIAQALGFALNIPVNKKINKPLVLKYT